MAVLVGAGVSVSDILYLSSVVLASIVLIVGFLVLCFSVYLHFFVHQKYKHIPGPPRSSFFLGNALDLRRYRDEGRLVTDAMVDWTEEHGPVIVMYIIHQVIISANSPEAVKVAFGLDLNLLYDEDSKFTKAIAKAIAGMDHFTKPAWYERKAIKETVEAGRLIRDIGRECVRNRLKANSNGENTRMREDLIALLLESSESINGDGPVDMEYILDEFVTVFLAGMEVTSSSISFAFIEMCLNEEIMYRLQTEVDAVVSDNEVQFEELSKLTYTSTVLKESLRKYPPATTTVRDATNDVTLHGVTIPRGAYVAISTYVLGRLEKYFKDPLFFDPDRFSREKEVIPHTYVPFGVGPRSCVGQQFAVIESKVLISKLLKNFTFELVPEQSLEVVQAGTIKPKDGCKVLLTHRNA